MFSSAVLKKCEVGILSFGLIISFLILYFGFITIPTYGTLFFSEDDKLTLVIDNFQLDYEILSLDTNISLIPGIFFLYTHPSFSVPTLFEGDSLSDTKFTFLFNNSSPDSVTANITELNKTMLIYTRGFGALDIANPILLVGFKIINTSNPLQLGYLCYEFDAFPVTTTRWAFDHEHSYFQLIGLNRYQTINATSNAPFPYVETNYELYHSSSRIASMQAVDPYFSFNAKSGTITDLTNHGSRLNITNLDLTMSMNISLRWLYGKI